MILTTFRKSVLRKRPNRPVYVEQAAFLTITSRDFCRENLSSYSLIPLLAALK